MIIHNVAQGSPEWLALRANFKTASEAPAMMGESKQIKRTDLLNAKKTGLDRDVSWWVQTFLFDKGHEAEANGRPIVEASIGEDLFPVVGTEGDLLASMDGMTLLGETLFEHKMWNEQLAADVRAGTLDPHYYWQLEQQLLVSGAEKVIFVCSDGTEQNFVSMEYLAVPGRAETLVAGWKQFDADLLEYTPAEVVAETIGKTPETLPALRIEVTGMVTASNLDQFKAHSLAVFDAINTELETDQHFADAEKAVKWCGDVEERLEAAKQHALSQTESIDLLFRTIDEISAEARAKRLMLNKLVQARKISIREDIVMDAAKELQKHVDQINESLGGKARLPVIPAGFANAIKGKKTISSLRDAAGSELARAKIAASETGDKMRANLATLVELAADYTFLFNDIQQLVMKDNADLALLINARIADHKRVEDEKAEAQREKIRKEELQRIANEQEAERLAAIKPEPVVEPVAEPAPVQQAPVQQSKPAQQAAKPAASAPAQAMQAEVFDLEALVQAVAAGQVPVTVLTVKWEVLDALVAEQGTSFNAPGVRLVRVAA